MLLSQSIVLVVLGGHSADVMMTEVEVINFIKAGYNKGAIVGAIGGGSIPLIIGYLRS